MLGMSDEVGEELEGLAPDCNMVSVSQEGAVGKIDLKVVEPVPALFLRSHKRGKVAGDWPGSAGLADGAREVLTVTGMGDGNNWQSLSNPHR